jgi:uncharacterized membrane protein
MTIHPILVHFPIALLTLYAVIEIFRFRAIVLHQGLQSAKKVFLYIGVIMAFLTILAGSHDAGISDGPATYVSPKFVDIHAMFGLLTFIWFGLIALCYLFENSIKWPRVARVAGYVTKTPVLVVIVALIGLSIVFLTGALGGAIVYSHTDPFGQFLLLMVGN